MSESEVQANDESAIQDVDTWIVTQNFSHTGEISIPPRQSDQVIGQDEAVRVVRKAAEQKRHVMLIGEPGTGKSMLASSMVEFLPRGELQDVIAYHNPEDPNEPKIRIVPAGKGKEIVNAQRAEMLQRRQQKASVYWMLVLLIIIASIAVFIYSKPPDPSILLFGVIAAIFIWFFMRYTGQRQESIMVPKLLISHSPDDMPPFIDATGAHAGALLGDVKHDPFQSGGLETPAHERLEVGAIHKANKGVLFIDEINLLRIESQQSLLTAMQEGKFPILGQSERSSGAMVKSEPVPCDFVLVAAGNLDALQGMHPALRSRIRGYGYEVYMNTTMPDNNLNRQKLVRFVAQEVVKDKKIPHFDKFAVAEVIKEAQRRAGRKGRLTLRLRELGGLVRVSGDIAREEGSELVHREHVTKAKKIARSLEQQVADRYVQRRKEYNTILTTGGMIGTVNGLAALGADSGMSEFSGIVLPIVAEVTPAHTRSGGRVIATGKLGEIAKEAVDNVSAIIKKYSGEDISNHDIHIQFIGTYEGVEGDSASVSIATAVISAFEKVPVDQSIAMTGSLSVRGHVLPVGGVTAKVEAAAETGLAEVILPADNLGDVILEPKYEGKIKIFTVRTLLDVLKEALVAGPEKDRLIAKISSIFAPPSEVEEPVETVPQQAAKIKGSRPLPR
ncbi:MAG: ATP-dependent protease LonB [Thermoplasmata archaeon YP2-bin.285]|uniref:Archaeal Lon protease n=1 Tax=Candidatus Sysuiplasma superficiale TaxID=2823368 RepID=A0A8J8CBU3_9ARCH|nr:ATP-dependent protease LonB [Candidatus Sysuiplasma superficiale]